MSCKKKRGILLILLLGISYFYTFQRCCAVSLGQRKDASSAQRAQKSTRRTEQDIHRQLGPLPAGGPVTGRPTRREPRRIGHPELHQALAAPPRKPIHADGPEVVESDVGLNGSSWTLGEVLTERKPPPAHPEDGYQADFTGFSEIQGEVLGLSSDSSPHFSEWEAMKPEVECDDTFMIFSASGHGLLHLLVDRNEATPISIFQLPADCGYSVRTSWRDLEMMVPYDGCYVIQENGSYVLPMQWLSTSLKLSCPVKMSTAAPMVSLFTPSVFCSAFGMAVQIPWQERDQPALGVVVDGAWGPFVSDLCAFEVDSQPQELTFLISQRAPCITADDSLRLQLTLDDEEYVLSCPVGPDFPYSPSPPPQFPFSPDSVIPVSTSSLAPTSLTPNQAPSVQLSNNQQSYYLYAGPQNHQLPQDYASGPQSVNAHNPRVDGPTGPQQKLQSPYFDKQLFYPHPFLLQGPITHQMSPVPVGQHPYPFVFYHPDPSFYQLTSDPAGEALKPQVSHPDANPQTYHPAITAAPATQAPALYHPPPSGPKQSLGSKPQTNIFYPQASYYSHRSVSHTAARVAASPNSPTASPSDSVRYPPAQLYAHSPFHPHAHQSPAGESPQNPAAPRRMCLSSSDPSCSYHSYPYSSHPFYPQQPYSSSSHYPQTPVANPSTPPAQNRLQTPHLQCLTGRMFVFLPYADPRSIHILEHQRTWKLLSDMPSHCGFVLQQIRDHGVLLHSPLPACHSYFRTPTTISLPVRFWDGSVGQNRTMDLECPYQKPSESPAPVSSSVPAPHQPTKDEGSQSGFGKSEVFCSSQQMNIALPAGPISEIIVKDARGNRITLNDQKDCGYYINKGKDGKTHLIYQLHSHCHQSVEGEMHVISVIYITENGQKEAQFSCPVVIPRSGQECNLHSEYRLPCGSGSITQTQCLSMGCCFNKHPFECYYPMEECTIDRRMVFSVPASITDPPLSPALLVAANNSTCKPQKVTSEYALFNIPMDGCGMRRMMVGKTLVYMLEITNMIQAVSLNYGTITRESPIRLFVECRYSPGTVLSVSYVVKTPSFGPDVHTQGVFGVQLRISKDAQYTSYHPQYHQPLRMLLGKPLHLEVRLLNSPDPSLVLLVHFCVAYPRSGKAVWVLLYNGCPNPLDPSPSKTVLSGPKPPTPQSQTRRFTITTFQFLPAADYKDMDEEIYFMCSTEICSPHEGPCVEGCFGR
ncbi:uncharacterized protein LOC101164209 [Oryzias latipes]|uniref:ZP domain-containing protein n=1 Tax=Oryzias latipes TaxID=8090 RepID=H2LH79_ORYLA|nr:uncharacterized protein LOC101164209 [Oryzias latipes]